jgi:hypothetical protein
MPWVREGDKVRCRRHDVLFDPSMGSCATCDKDPGPEITSDGDTDLPAAPDGCLSSESIERWFVSLAVASRRAATKIAKGKIVTLQSESTVAKHREVAIKAMRAAAEFALRREDEAIVRAREKRIRDRMRGASH